jgi:anthranilate synthase component 2
MKRATVKKRTTGGRRAAPKAVTSRRATPKRAAIRKPSTARRAAAKPETAAPRLGGTAKAPIVIIDNYDSFTYNLVQYLGALGAAVEVFRNDAITVAQVEKLHPAGIVISPGPGGPEDAGISIALIRKLSGRVPILGVCLGNQAIGVAYGGRVVRADQVMHGKTSRIIHDGRGIFRGLDNPFIATRYHSLVVEREGLPDSLEVTCSTSDAVIMGLKVHGVETWGVQFHPESILTRQGKDLLRNFLDLCGI